MVCFLSFLMERRLEMLLCDGKDKDMEISPERIREALNSMQLASLELNNEEVYIKIKNQPLGNLIFKKLKLKLLKNINNKDKINECFKNKQKDLWEQLSLF